VSFFQLFTVDFFLLLDIQFIYPMKRNLLLTTAVIAVMTLVNFKASAQNTPTGATTAAINITDSYAILVKDANVQIDYTTQAHFVDNRTKLMPGHITVFSNRKYKVDVKAGGAFIDPAVEASTMPSNIMSVAVTSPAATGDVTYTTQALTGTNAPIIELAPPTELETYDITYSIPLLSSILGIPTGLYKTSVTYTLTQQ
jgi:hypothetical protein